MKNLVKTTTIVFAIITLLIGCENSDKTIPEKMISCFEKNVFNRQKSLGFNQGQGFNKTFETFENFLIEQKYIKEVGKSEYNNFIKEVVNNPKSFLKIKHHIEDLNIYESHYYLMDPSLMLIECSDFILVTESHEITSTLNLQNKIIRVIVENDYSNLQLIDELFKATPKEDFEEIVYRIPFVYLIIMNVLDNNLTDTQN